MKRGIVGALLLCGALFSRAGRAADLASPAIPGIQRCYEAGLQRNPSLAGRVVISWTIVRGGAVKNARIDSVSLADGWVAACALGVVATTVYMHVGVFGMPVSYPFVFVPGQGVK